MAAHPSTNPGTHSGDIAAVTPAMSPSAVVAGRYEMVELIGTGGMGEVWRARHLALDRQVAIKLLRTAVGASELAKQRFLREAQLTASVASRHAVQVHDFGVTEDGMPYLVMELLRGQTLRERLDVDGRLGVDETLAILKQVARSLERSHGGGVVHCDLKPDNIVLGTDEDGGLLVKVLDFGIARMLGELVPASAEHATLPAGGDPRKTLTRFGDVVGTPGYMAPEQFFAPAEVGPATDVYAFGVVAYECLTGELPFDDPRCSRAALMERNAPWAHLTNAVVSILFTSWFEAATELRAEDRFADVGDAFCALEVALIRDDAASTTRPAPPPDEPAPAPEAARGPGPRARRASLVMAMSVASLLVAAAALAAAVAPDRPTAPASLHDGLAAAADAARQASSAAVAAAPASGVDTGRAALAQPEVAPHAPPAPAAPSQPRRAEKHDAPPPVGSSEAAAGSTPSPERQPPARTAMELPSLGF